MAITTINAHFLLGKKIWDKVYNTQTMAKAEVSEDDIILHQVMSLMRASLWNMSTKIGKPEEAIRKAAEDFVGEQLAKKHRTN